MGYNHKVLEFLCDRFIIPDLVSVKVQGKRMYFTKETYKIMSEYEHKDSFVFDLSKISIGERILNIFEKFYLRPSKETYRHLIRYCESELDKDMLYVIFNNNILVVMESLKGMTPNIINSLNNK